MDRGGKVSSPELPGDETPEPTASHIALPPEACHTRYLHPSLKGQSLVDLR